jgi:A/G-specific adenine glycosylase
MLFRVFIGRGDPKAHAVKRRLWKISTALVPVKDVFDFNQGLMDLGATICTPRHPKCLLCPVSSMCRTQSPPRT